MAPDALSVKIRSMNDVSQPGSKVEGTTMNRPAGKSIRRVDCMGIKTPEQIINFENKIKIKFQISTKKCATEAAKDHSMNKIEVIAAENIKRKEVYLLSL